MAKEEKDEQIKNKKNGKPNKDKKSKDEKPAIQLLTNRTKRWIKAIVMFLVAVITGLSFWGMSGRVGNGFAWFSKFLIGQAVVFAIPILFFLGGLIFLKPKQKSKFLPVFLGIFILIFGGAGILGSQNLLARDGGVLGYGLGLLVVNLFGLLVADIIFSATIVVGLIIFLQTIWANRPPVQDADIEKLTKDAKEKVSFFSKIIPQKPLSVKVKEAEEKTNGINRDAQPKISLFKNDKPVDPKMAAIAAARNTRSKERYIFPPIDLLAKNEGVPTSGNIKENSLIIKKTLENFGIPVEMAEANVGPTVTQYAFKPAEGVKLSKITTLSNNLALALAAHPIRIEAPIPGKSLVGIEIPNKNRSIVSLRNLIASPQYQSANSPLLFVLGRNVSGQPVFADLTELPHLLVAGSTGTGKTIYLNSLILSLLYKNSPSTMKMILIDPKRVEFAHYNNLPHLLCPVIHDAGKTINALNWLVGEMQRRFEVFSEVPTRNLDTYNKNKNIIAAGKTLPYIVLIVDELADLMAAKGRELEAGIVRLAQMARATGIHLVLATQRPSVEVITGLIKANVSSRVTFQVASQVDSRTVLDAAGAEKLLGAGDMLFISAKSPRPRRIQGPYVPEDDVRKVAEFIGKQNAAEDDTAVMLSQSLQDSLERADEVALAKENAANAPESSGYDTDDPMYDEAKKIVNETKKASASFLQRRLKLGYARAARLIDMLEENGIVGPADGAKPREVYSANEKTSLMTSEGSMDGHPIEDEIIPTPVEEPEEVREEEEEVTETKTETETEETTEEESEEKGEEMKEQMPQEAASPQGSGETKEKPIKRVKPVRKPTLDEIAYGKKENILEPDDDEWQKI